VGDRTRLAEKTLPQSDAFAGIAQVADEAHHQKTVEPPTPESAMKPTAAVMENGRPRSQSATMPLVRRSGHARKD